MSLHVQGTERNRSLCANSAPFFLLKNLNNKRFLLLQLRKEARKVHDHFCTSQIGRGFLLAEAQGNDP